MKKFKSIFTLLIAMYAVVMMSSCTRIDAACEGIKVNLYGSDKGVDDVVLVSGMVWFNPFTEEVYEYPTYVQMVDYEPFEIDAKGGGKFTIDPTININPIYGKSAAIFKKYRKSLDEVLHKVLKTHIENAFRVKLNAYTVDELVSKREEFEKSIEEHLREVLAKENFELGEMTSGLKYPAAIEDAIIAKNQAVQKALQIENEIAAIDAEAKKKVVAARGFADSLKIVADGEAYYNRTVSASLSNTLVQMKALEKWDGKTPIVSGGGSTFIDASKFVK